MSEVSCDLLSDFLTLRDIHNLLYEEVGEPCSCDLLSDFLTLRDIHNQR